MKKILSALFVFAAIYQAFAQAPQGINYQGVARDNQGQAFSITNISVQVTIQNGSGTVYQEHQTVTTDTFGLYNIVIGSAAAVVTNGTFASIPWSAGNLMVTIDIDPLGGTAFTTVSSMNLQSVPYALYAQSAGSSSSGVTSITGGAGIDASPSTITTTGSFSLAPSGVIANTYGGVNTIPVIAVDNMGRITSASNQTFSPGNVVLAGNGLTSSVTSNSVTLNASTTSPIWNAGYLMNNAINIGTLAANDMLQFNGTNWVNVPPPGGLPSGINGQLLFNNGSNWVPSNTNNLFFSGTNLGMGTTSPSALIDLQSTTGTVPLLNAVTTGSGFTAKFSGGAGVQVDKIQIGGATSNGYVLTSDPSGNASWQPSSGGGLPAPQLGSVLYANSATTWTPSVPSQFSFDGNSISVTNTTTVGTAGTFITNNASAANAPALLVQSNSSTGYAIRADNSAGAAILANSGGPYAISGNISGGSGDAVAGWVRNSSSGNGINGLIDNTSTGVAGYFENQNASNPQPVVQVTNAGTGPSAIFSGGSGVQIDQLKIGSGTVGGNVLTSDNFGNASWQPASSGTVAVSGPILGNGTPPSPLQLGLNTGNIFIGDPSNLAVPVVVSGDISLAGSGAATVQGLQGISVSSVAPSLNQVLQYNGAQWAPGNAATVTSVAGAGPALSGTVTTSGVITANNGTALWNANQFQGISVSSVPPSNNQVLVYNGAQWAPTNLSSSALSGVWTTTGNSVLGTDYLGTTNTQPLIIATSNTVTQQPIIFKTGGLAPANEKMRIDASGNVGIGATSPATQLHVFGSSPEIRVESTGGAFTSGFGIKTATHQWFIGQENGGAQLFRIKDVSAGVVRMEIEALNGNTGINKTNPAAQLDVASTSTVTTIAATNAGTAGSAGDFLVNNGGNGSAALNVTTTGSGNASFFSIGNNGNNNAVIYATTNGTGSAGVFSITNVNGTGVALDVANQGLSQTGSFITNNSSNSNYALNVATNGTGNAGNFQINNVGSNATVINAATTGGGIAVSATSNAGSAVNATAGAGTAVMARNTSNNATIDVANTGTGPAFSAISGGGNNSDVLKSTSSGTGNAIVGVNNGSGSAGSFSTGAGNSQPTLQVNTTGTGFSGNFVGGQGLKTDGFTADLKIVPNGGLIMGGADYFFIIPNGTTGNLTLPPANATTKGKVYVVKTLGTAYNCGGGTTYVSIAGVAGQNNFPANSVIRLVCDGSAWQAW